jgi:hypothetical protein
MVKALAVIIAVTKPSHDSAEAVADSDLTSKRWSATNPPAKINNIPAN